MIVDADQRTVISSFGWIDRNSLWVLDPATGDAHSVKVEHADWIEVIAGDGEYFATVENSRSAPPLISVRRFDRLAGPVASARIDGHGGPLLGQRDAWKHVPTVYIAQGAFVRVLVDERRWEWQPMTWFDDSYDKGYQGIAGALEIPGENTVIVSVQRDSHPILYDPELRRATGKLSLRRAGAKLNFRRKTREVWAADGNLLIRIDPRDWKTIASLPLHDTAADTSTFIGDWSFTSDESHCCLPRPMNGDVLFVDADSFAVVERSVTGGQPIEAIRIDRIGILARDWKSGRLLHAS